MRNIAYWGKVVSLGIILGVGIQFAEAWTNPTVSAPGGNVAGPLNTGVINQVKNASLGLIGNLAANMLQINGVATEGAACSSTGLVARDTGGMILSCQSGKWGKAMGSGAVPSVGNFLQAYAGKTLTFSSFGGYNVSGKVVISADKAVVSGKTGGGKVLGPCSVTALSSSCSADNLLILSVGTTGLKVSAPETVWGADPKVSKGINSDELNAGQTSF